MLNNFSELRADGGLKFTSSPDRKASVKYLTNELSQEGAHNH